jgi:hypothetical protein
MRALKHRDVKVGGVSRVDSLTLIFGRRHGEARY